jgi:hydrogenase expression/formation protein HypC
MCLAVPGRIIRLENRDDTMMAEVDFGGLRKDVCMEYIPDAEIGEYVIVHVGFAIQRLDEASAKQTLDNFERMGVLEEEFGDGFAIAARQAGEDPSSPGPPAGEAERSPQSSGPGRSTGHEGKGQP